MGGEIWPTLLGNLTHFSLVLLIPQMHQILTQILTNGTSLEKRNERAFQ